MPVDATPKQSNEGLESAPETLALVSLSEATRLWLRIGLLSFGGPAGQVALMHRELVEKRRWISDERFSHAFNFCTLIPGPEAQQLATYIGWLMLGVRGGLIAGALFVLPGAILMLGLSVLYALFHRVPAVDALFFGVKAAILVVVFEALSRMARRALTTVGAKVVAGLTFAALYFFAIPFPLMIAVSGLVGAIGLVQRPPATPTTSKASESVVDALMRSGQLVHVEPNLIRAASTALFWIALWVAPTLALFILRGKGDVLFREGLFFSQAATVTFGGAYAVLGWVAQEAVNSGWLTSAQMLDGLGLAETTPGPLILVLQFVGFMAAFQNPMDLPPLLAGCLGAALALWASFVPSFLWIFTLGPSVESLRKSRRLGHALSAISAAAVGVLLNLSLSLAIQTLFAKTRLLSSSIMTVIVPDVTTLNIGACAIACLAFALLFKWKKSLALTLFVCAIAGLASKSLR
jgi:chromate transporter